jgi:hypothetical protein
MNESLAGPCHASFERSPKEGIMATINRIEGKGIEKFKQIEGDGWLSASLPAICAGTVMAVVLFLAISCSRKSDKPAVKIDAPAAPAVKSSEPVAAVPATEAKKVKKHRPRNATYVNSLYGISFSYPRKYSLQVGAQPSSMPLPANFVKPGAIGIAAVDLPDDAYPQTDFSSALMSVSVNPALTAEECALFAATEGNPDQVQPVPVKVGANEFTEFEQMDGPAEHQSDRKYFHLFKNGACYEFALDVETSHKADEDLAQLERGKVFQQLERIVASVRIKEVNPEKSLEAATTAPAAAVADATAEKAQMSTSTEQK